MGDRKVFKYKDVVLLESDLETLQEPGLLSDPIIAFYFRYLSSSCDTDDIPLVPPSESSYDTGDILLVPPPKSFLLANCEDDKVPSMAESYKLSTKRLVIFPVNDCDKNTKGDSGSHWSVLVYVRSMNAFLHFDSMGGANNIPAEKLYDAVKNYMGVGGEVSRKQISSTRKKQKYKNKKVKPVSKPSAVINAAAPAGLPVFKECKTPQQSNGHDCGIYVLAIARVIVKWFKDGSNSDVLSVVAKDVDQSVESRMRTEIRMKLVDDLRKSQL